MRTGLGQTVETCSVTIAFRWFIVLSYTFLAFFASREYLAHYIKIYVICGNEVNDVELSYLQIFKSCEVAKGVTWYVVYQVILQKPLKKKESNFKIYLCILLLMNKS